MSDESPRQPVVRKVGRRKLLEYWWVLPVGGTLGTLGYMLNMAKRVTLDKRRAGAPRFQDRPARRVASTSDLPDAYAMRVFTYADTPSVLVRLPDATAHSLTVDGRHFIAFSRVCTHLGCLVNPQPNPEAVALTFNYRTDHPVLGCPCHFAVFDPVLEGESVIGRAIYPLPRVRLVARGADLYATGIEAPPASG